MAMPLFALLMPPAHLMLMLQRGGRLCPRLYRKILLPFCV